MVNVMCGVDRSTPHHVDPVGATAPLVPTPRCLGEVRRHGKSRHHRGESDAVAGQVSTPLRRFIGCAGAIEGLYGCR